jgi:hypothetical protein
MVKKLVSSHGNEGSIPFNDILNLVLNDYNMLTCVINDWNMTMCVLNDYMFLFLSVNPHGHYT